MSLFIGKDYSNAAVLHLTSGQHTEAEMKSGIQTDTIFHNDLNFLTYDLIPVTMSCISATHITSTVYMYRMNIALPSLESYISYEFLDANYNKLDKGQIFWYDNSGYTNTSTTNYKGGGSYPGNVWPIGQINNYCKATVAASIKYVLKIYKSKLLGGSGVTVGNGDIVVGGKSLLTFRYIYQGTLNNVSPQIDPGTQLIDTSKISGPLEIESNLAGTSIRKGGVLVIGGHGFIEGTGTVSTYTVNMPANTVSNSAVIHTIVPGDIAIVTVDGKVMWLDSTSTLTVNLSFTITYPPQPHHYANVNMVVSGGAISFSWVFEAAGGYTANLKVEEWVK